MQKTRPLKTARQKPPAPKGLKAQPLAESQFPKDMRPSFCRFVRHMLQGTAARLAISNLFSDQKRKKFIEIIKKINWNGSSKDAKKAVEEAIEFLTKLRRDHEKADKPFFDETIFDEADKELFFKNIHLAQLYLNKVLSLLVGGPHLMVKEDIRLERIIGDTSSLVNANGSNGDGCSFESFAGFTVREMAKFINSNPRHPATIFVKRNRMTLEALAAHVHQKREECPASKPFKVNYEHATGTDIFNVDRIELFLLLENLLSNAMRAGATEVKITSRKSLLSPRMAEISVEDNGKGFTRRQLKKANLGESFSTKKKGNGEVNGVGITHCRFIVEQHGGEFAIASVRGKGTTISFTLPLSNQK